MRLIQVDGNLAADAEVKVSSKGNKFLQFRMASNEYGEDGPVWINVISWNDFDINRAQWMLKGRHVVVSGTFKPTAYISKHSPEPVAGIDIRADRIEWLNTGKPDSEKDKQATVTGQQQVQYQQQQPQYQQPMMQQPQQPQQYQQPMMQQPQQFQPQQNVAPIMDDDDLPF